MLKRHERLLVQVTCKPSRRKRSRTSSADTAYMMPCLVNSSGAEGVIRVPANELR